MLELSDEGRFPLYLRVFNAQNRVLRENAALTGGHARVHNWGLIAAPTMALGGDVFESAR